VTTVTIGASNGPATSGTCTSTTSINCVVVGQDIGNDVTGANAALSSTACGGNPCYGQTVFLDNGSSQTPTIAGAGTVNAGTYVDVCNINTGVQTLTPAAGTIGGSATKAYAAGTAASPAGCNRLESDGSSNWWVKPYGGSVAIGSVTGLGTGVATALGNNTGAASGMVTGGSSITSPISATGQLAQANGGGGMAHMTPNSAGTYMATFSTSGSAGSVSASGGMCFTPIWIGLPVTLEGIGFQIGTGYSGSGTGFAVGLYSSDTGASANRAKTLLASSTISSSTGTGATTLAFQSNYSITSPGWYWLAFQFGDATQKIYALQATSYQFIPGAFMGSSTFASLRTGIFGLSATAPSPGTMPATAPSMSEITASGSSCWLAAEIASQP